jgi:hypothetical protein
MLAWIADAFMMMGYSLFKPQIVKVIDDIEEEVSQWEGITTSIHPYGGRQFNYHNKELGHIHGNGVLDILFNRAIKTRLVNEGIANEHHTFKKSGWVSFYLKNVADYETGIQLLKLAWRCKKEDRHQMGAAYNQ